MSKKRKAWEKKKKSFTGECDYCKIKIVLLDGFYCWACRRWFCTTHRMPEDHKCIGLYKERHKELNMPAGRILYSKGKSQYEPK